MPANEALDPSLKDLARQGLISFTKHKRPISSEDLEVLQQISWVWMFQKVFQIWHVLSLTPFSTSEREAVKTNARWNHYTFSSKQQQASWSTSSQERERRKISPPSSATDFTHSVFHRCEFSDWDTFLSSQVFEQFVGIYEPNAPSFRVFSLFQALCQWRTEKASGRRVGPGREKGEIRRSPALSFSLPDPARRWSRSSPARFFSPPLSLEQAIEFLIQGALREYIHRTACQISSNHSGNKVS